MAALLLLPVLAAVQVATAAPAQAVVVAGFEIDGNTPDGAETGVDWGTPTGTTASDPVGNIDTTTFKGSKEFEHPSTWEQGTGLAPNQDDISDVYFHDDIVDDDIWGYIGFRRFTTSGTTNFDVEFNKLPNATAATHLPVRSIGDVMVRFEQDGNSAFALTAAWFWTRVASPDWGTGCIEVPGYTPRSGWCSESIGSVPFTGVTGESGHFAEGAFNFSTLLEQAGGSTTCAGGDFGTMNLRSFTGNANESALKDYVNPLTIDIDDTCGELEIYKVDQFGASVPGATFSISPNPIPGETTDPLVIVEGGPNDPDATADGAIVIDPATPGTYTVIETAAPPGYELVQPASARTWTVTVGQNGVGSVNVPLSVTNRLFFAPPTILNEPDYDIDHNWEVTKSVAAPTTVNVPEGTPASFDYTVTLKALQATRTDYGGTVTINNPNNHGMRGTLSTGITGGSACTIDTITDLDGDGTNGFQVNLPKGDNVFTYSCNVASDVEPPAGTTATITWNQTTFPSSDPAETYTRSDASPFVIDQTVDETTTVTDVFNGDATTTRTWGPFNWNDVRNPNANPAHTIVVATYSRNVAGVPGDCTPYDNVVAESADGTTDTESVTVCVGKDLDLTKDANLGFQRDLLWSIVKGGPGTVFTGEDANGDLKRMVRYTIDVTARGKSDSAWALTGKIWVDNPNNWDVTGTITDTVVIDGKTIACDVDALDVGGAGGPAGHQVTIPKNAVDHEFSYSCTGVEEGSYVGKNTVSFDYTADSHQYPDTDDTATRTVDVEVDGDPDPAHQTVTITDLLDGADVTGSLSKSQFDWTAVNQMADNTERVTLDVLLGTTADQCTDHTNVVSIDGLTYPGTSDDHTVTVCAPGVDKSIVADFGQKQLWGLTKQVDKTRVVIAEGGQATFSYIVRATPGDVVDDGTSSWTGAISVHNPSTTTALTVDVADLPAVAGWTCDLLDDSSAVQIAPGATLEIDYACSGTGHPSGTNTVQVSFDQDQRVRKTRGVAFSARPDVRDSVVEVRDDKTNLGQSVLLGEADASDPDTWAFEYSLVKTGAAGACTTYTNNAVAVLEASADPTAQAQAELCVERPLTVDVSAEGTFGVTYPWTIEKNVDRTRAEVDAATGEATFDYTVTVRAGQAQPAGWTMGGTIHVSNPNGYTGGAITLTDADVTTDVGGGSSCTATLPATPVVPAGSPGTLSVPFTCTFTGEPRTTGTVSATVEWDPAGAAAQATASDSGPATLTVGQETHKTVDVIDDKTDPASPVLLEEDLTWSDGLVKTYDYSLTIPGTAGTCVDRTNTAIVDLTPGSGPEGDNPSDQQTVTVCVESPLGAQAQATADLARAYAWSIDKSVDATQRTVDTSGNAIFRYTVVARAGQSTDSGWAMSGSVTLTNPNTYEDGDITADVAAVSDLGGGAACVVTGGDDVVVPAEAAGTGSVTLPIECTFSSKPASSGELTVTATWDPAGPASSASTDDSAPVSFAVRSETNKVVDVVDDKTRPGQRVVLEKGVVWSAGLVKTYTYDLALAGGAAGTCRTYTNTAVVDVPSGADPTDSTTTAVCVPVTPPPPVTPPEVLPAEAFGKAVGNVKATCQGTVRAKLKNRSGVRVTYKLRVGKKVHRINVRSLENEKFRTKGKARAKVTLKLGKSVLDRVRIPKRCAPPEVLPATGLRTAAVQARLTSMTTRWH